MQAHASYFLSLYTLDDVFTSFISFQCMVLPCYQVVQVSKGVIFDHSLFSPPYWISHHTFNPASLIDSSFSINCPPALRLQIRPLWFFLSGLISLPPGVLHSSNWFSTQWPELSFKNLNPLFRIFQSLSWVRRMELEESTCLTSGSTTKQQ